MIATPLSRGHLGITVNACMNYQSVGEVMFSNRHLELSSAESERLTEPYVGIISLVPDKPSTLP